MSEEWSAEHAAARLGLQRSDPRPPSGAYQTAVQSGDLLFLAGHGPAEPGRPLITGKLGETMTIADGKHAARVATVNVLNSVRHAVGSLDRVEQLLQLQVMINATPSFVDHVAVADGASELLAEVFGPRSAHARSAVGHSSLPFNIPVSIQLVARISL